MPQLHLTTPVTIFTAWGRSRGRRSKSCCLGRADVTLKVHCRNIYTLARTDRRRARTDDPPEVLHSLISLHRLLLTLQQERDGVCSVCLGEAANLDQKTGHDLCLVTTFCGEFGKNSKTEAVKLAGTPRAALRPSNARPQRLLSLVAPQRG